MKEFAVGMMIFGVVLGALLLLSEVNNEKSEIISLPLNVVIVEGEVGSGRSEENIEKLIGDVNSIWGVANITFYIKDIRHVGMGTEDVETAMLDGKKFADADEYDKGAVNIVFIKNMSHNGVSFTNHKMVVMPDKTTNREYVAAAHELGHVMGLGHNPDEEFLMYSVCNETEMTFFETLGARRSARALLSS